MKTSIPTLVFDFGSDTIKAGLATSEKPDFIIPSCFPKGNETFNNLNNNAPIEGELDYAIVNGEVCNKKRVQIIFGLVLQHYFPEEDPEELRVIFNETPFASKDNIKFLAETAFNDLGATEVSIKPQAVFSLAFSSLKTCVCLDVGHDIAQCIAQSNLFVISPAIQRSILAGHALDYFASRVLLEKDDIKTYDDLKEVRQLKESLSVPLNLQEEVAKVTDDDDDKLYQLTLGEILFKPALMEEAADDPDKPQEDPRVAHYMEAPTPAELIKNCIEATDLSLRGELWNNIIVCGGTAKMTGFRERLDKELNAIKPPNCGTIQCKYIDDDLTLLTWKGAAASAQFDSKENWLSIDDYEENNEVLFEKFRQFGTSFEPPKK